MLKGTKEGILIEIRSLQDLKDLEEKVESKKFFYKDTRFLMSQKDQELFNKVSQILESNGYTLYAEREENIIREKINEIYIKEKEEEQLAVTSSFNSQITEEKSLILKKTVRSGQRIEFDGTVIVLGSANPGSEIVATGDIYVFGKAMGLLHAGSKGDKNRIIVALKLDVVQIRIANAYAKGEDRTKYDKEFARIAEKAFLDKKGNLIIEEYRPYD